MVPRINFFVRDHRQNAAAPLVACGFLVCVAIKSWLSPATCIGLAKKSACLFHDAEIGTAEIPKIADGLAATPKSAADAKERNRLYDRPLVKGGTYFFVFVPSILLFDLDTPSFRPDPANFGSAARKICRGRRVSAAPIGACP